MSLAALTTLVQRLASLIRQLQGMLAGDRRVRGTVTSAGGVSAASSTTGSGWTPLKTGTGQYTVTYETAFSRVPSVLVTLDAGTATGIKVLTRSAAAFTVLAYDSSTLAAADGAFSFAALG